MAYKIVKYTSKFRSKVMFPVQCSYLKLTVITLLTISSVWGSPITRRQFREVKMLLQKDVPLAYPSDDKDLYSDLLIQAKYDKKNLTYYHAGDPKLPVFISYGMGYIGKPVHTLLRGEDYLNPRDRNTYVVLRQTSKPDTYALHIAYVVDMNHGIHRSNVMWYDALVEQKRRLKSLLMQVGNFEMQSRAVRSKRPRCDWVGFLLLCDSAKNIPPLRGTRQEREPKDVEDEEPVKLPGVSDEESTGGTGGGSGAGGDGSGAGGGGSKGKREGDDQKKSTKDQKPGSSSSPSEPDKSKPSEPSGPPESSNKPQPGNDVDSESGEHHKYFVFKPGKGGTSKPGHLQHIPKQQVKAAGRSMDDEDHRDDEHASKKKHKKKRKTKRKEHD